MQNAVFFGPDITISKVRLDVLVEGCVHAGKGYINVEDGKNVGTRCSDGEYLFAKYLGKTN